MQNGLVANADKKITTPGLEKVLELLLLKLTERKEKLSIIGHMSEIITFQGRHRRQDCQDPGFCEIEHGAGRIGMPVVSKITCLRIVMNEIVEPRHNERERETLKFDEGE